jgi:Uma2 family endonuclease
MNEMVISLTKVEHSAPQRLKMSYEEYLDLARDDQIVEWVEGEVLVHMPPIDKHQDLSLFLTELLSAFIRFFNLGILRYAPFEVKLWSSGPSREPDIFFVATENLSKLTSPRLEGAPDLIIEIISPGSVTEDRVHKFTQYEQAGVKEYWLIDPRPYQVQADFYVLGEDQRYQAASLEEDGQYRSTVLPDFWLKLAWLWESPLPNPQLAFAEVMTSIETLPAEVKAAYQALYEILLRQSPKED